MANVPARTSVPLPEIIKRALRQLEQLLRERAHAQLVINVRDGRIQLINVNRQYLPDNLPES
jgi:hypothetical protein